jgi:diguanylate cyclase (GGDEF)-like protein
MMPSIAESCLHLPTRRILLVDDNPEIHKDIMGILRPQQDNPLAIVEAELFGDVSPDDRKRSPVQYELESAFQGEQALTMVEQAIRAGRPYSMAIVDIRMPPGWDGIETIERLRQVDPALQIVICSAYSDYSWKAIDERLQATDWLLILRKPFEHAEIRQLASALTEKWNLGVKASLNIEALEELVKDHALQVQQANIEIEKRNGSLADANDRLSREMHARQLVDAEIRHIAFHDVLTSLPNRAFLMDRLNECVDRGKRQKGYRFAVLFIDIDSFKLVNDSLGHRAGDQLLTQFASAMLGAMRTMEASIRPSHDTVARLGGDEFIVLLDDIRDGDNVMSVARRIQQLTCLPLDVGGRRMTPNISIGAAISQNEYDDGIDVLRDADTALYHAKEQGKGKIAMFDQAMRSRVLERADVENDLQLAIANQEFVVYYQPIVSLATGKIVCLEALVRWEHPTRGLLPPDAFIPVAEQTGMIQAIGEQVLEQVAGQLGEWRATLPQAANLAVSVNLSAAQIVGNQLLDQVDRCLEQYGLEPSSLRIELTETTAMRNPELSKQVIDALVARGIEVYLDDFGTGYSSLSTLHTLPFAAIKLDKSFIASSESDAEVATTIRAMVMIAEHRNMRLIAEGIETFEQVTALRGLDCEYGQGFFFARPLSAHAIGEVLGNGSAYPLPSALEPAFAIESEGRGD